MSQYVKCVSDTVNRQQLINWNFQNGSFNERNTVKHDTPYRDTLDQNFGATMHHSSGFWHK